MLTKSTSYTLLTQVIIIGMSEVSLARPQGPLSSSIPFFYVSGNPFRDILLQHQMVRDRGLHGWVYVNTPPLRDVQELSAVSEGDQAAVFDDEKEPSAPGASPDVKVEEINNQKEERGNAEEVTVRTVSAHEEIIGRDFFEPVLDDDADNRPNIEIIELTARQEGQDGGAVVPLLLLEEVEDALDENDSEESNDGVEQLGNTTEFDNTSKNLLIGNEVSQINNSLVGLKEIESTTATEVEEATITTTATAGETTTEEVTTTTTTRTTTITTTTSTTTRSGEELQDPFVPPVGSFEAAVDHQTTVEMLMRQPKQRNPILKLVPSNRDPLLKLRDAVLPVNANGAVVHDSAVIKGALPTGALRLIRVGQLADVADGWEDATGRRRFVGTINAEGPPFFLNFRILPVGHAFDYDLNSDDFQGQQLDLTTELPITTTTQQVVVQKMTTTANPVKSEETTFNLLREQQNESEEEDEEIAIEIRSLESAEEVLGEETKEDQASPKNSASRLRQPQSFGRRVRVKSRTPRVINDGAVKAKDNGGIVFQPSVLEAEKRSEADNQAKTTQRFTCEGRKFGYYAHATDCRRYHVCLPHRAGGHRHWNFRCGPGTVFSVKHQACVHQDRVKIQC